MNIEYKDIVIEYFKQYGESEGFHIVEHILLRQRAASDPTLSTQTNPVGECVCPEVEDAYSFRASVFLPSWPTRFRNMAFRRFVEDTLRREAPAHLFLKICWINHPQMQEFEEAYNEWAVKLAELATRIAGADSDNMDGCTDLAGPIGYTHIESLKSLIAVIESRVNVYPVARLHDCTQTSGDESQVSLNNTSIGTL